MRGYLSAGALAGGVAGVLVGVADALSSGAPGMQLLVGYLAAAGLFLGAALGALVGVLQGLAARGAKRSERGPAQTLGWSVSAVLVLSLLPAVVTLFATSFRNQELSAIALVVALLGLGAMAVLVGASAAGFVERWLERASPRRRAHLARGARPLGAIAVALTIGIQALRYADSLAARDLRAGLLLAGWLAVAGLGGAWLAHRGTRLLRWPWLARRLALIVLIGCGYLTYQMLVGTAPKAVAAARKLVALADMTIAALEKTPEAPRPPSRVPAAVEQAADKPKPRTRPSILLVTIDSARADRFSLYGYPRPTTPRLDKLAGACAVFDRAYAASSSERDAVPALLAGVLPSRLRRSGGTWPRYLKGNSFLAEVLRDRGYRTVAVVSHGALRPTSGLRQGFQTYHLVAARPHERKRLEAVSSPRVLARAQRLLESPGQASKPMFLWVHFADPHGRYLSHPQGPQFGRRRADRYDAELAFTDQHLGKLLETIRKRPKPWFVAVAGDHGEALGERGRWGHGRTLGEAEVHVPLVLCGPGSSPNRYRKTVSVLDLYPTLVEVAGARRPPGRAGVSLLALLRDRKPRGPLVIENARRLNRLGRVALVDGSHKLVLVGAGNYPRLYDLGADPRERRNLARRRRTVVTRLRTALYRQRSAAGSGFNGVRQRVLSVSDDAAEREALRRSWRAKRKREEQIFGSPNAP